MIEKQSVSSILSLCINNGKRDILSEDVSHLNLLQDPKSAKKKKRSFSNASFHKPLGVTQIDIPIENLEKQILEDGFYTIE